MPGRALSWPLGVSAMLHGGLILLVWMHAAADRSPPITVLELITPDERPVTPVTSPVASPPPPLAPRHRAVPPTARVEPAPWPAAPAALPAPGPPPAAAPSTPSSAREPDAAAARPAEASQAPPAAPAAAPAAVSLAAPRPIDDVPPRYPETARRAGAEGTTLLRVRVLADGAVGEVRVERSAGHPALDAAARRAVQRWRFEPARRHGRPVEIWILLPVRFSLG